MRPIPNRHIFDQDLDEKAVQYGLRASCRKPCDGLDILKPQFAVAARLARLAYRTSS
jgi:hypothetical protein